MIITVYIMYDLKEGARRYNQLNFSAVPGRGDIIKIDGNIYIVGDIEWDKDSWSAEEVYKPTVFVTLK
jgi:hypothetical protein